MRQKKHIYFQYLLSLILVICLAAGCAAPFSPQPQKDSHETSGFSPENGSEAVPEHYDKNTLKAQQDFDQLAEDLFLDEVSQSLITLHYTLADPAAYGITDYEAALGTVSAEDSRQALSDIKSLKLQLSEIDSRLLRKDQLLTYTILSSYLNTALKSEGMELYDQPLSSSLGIQAQLPILLSEYAFYSRRDVEDYLSLLSSIDTYYESILTFEKERSQAGLGLCDTAIGRIADSCKAYLLDADHSFMAETFTERLNQVEGLTDEEKKEYISKNHKAINEDFVPAYQNLMDGLIALKGTGTNDKGLYYFPEGRRYYEYLVNASTGTSYTDIPSLKKAMGDQMMDDLTAMDELLTEDPSLAEKMYSYSFRLTDPDAILEDLKHQCQKDFPTISDYVCSIKPVPSALEPVLSPAFYLTVPIDRPQDNSIYINNGTTDSARSLYSTMAHEGYPGHMYQTLYFNRNNKCNLRKLLSFNSYSEGWATYVEYYSYRLDNGLEPGLGDLLQHNSAFTLALYAILDVNIHYEGWDIKQVGDYLNQYFRINDSSVITSIYYDIAENPANYLEYYVGYLEILNLQREAMKTLGSRYSAMEFNRFLLDIGPAPFSVIKPYFTEWLVGR